jgi:hypothetical protein
VKTLLSYRAIPAAALLASMAVATGAVAYASIPGPSGLISGCVSNQSVNNVHALVVIDSSATCPSGTTALSWNQQGPVGPQGQVGPAGPQGPAGATGPQGTSGVIGTLEQLNGIPCTRNNIVGTVSESLDPDAFARVRCIVPTSLTSTGVMTCGFNGGSFCSGATLVADNFNGGGSGVTVTAGNGLLIGINGGTPLTASPALPTDATGHGSAVLQSEGDVCAIYGVASGHSFSLVVTGTDPTGLPSATAAVTFNC